MDIKDISSTVVVEDGIRKAICGFTWPAIEFGEPPSCAYTFFEYVDAIRFGDLQRWKLIESETSEWWFPTLDRGAGALLHFAVDHGQLEVVKFLLKQRNVEVNQQDIKLGWTPLHRCARMAHYRNRPYLEVFRLLLEHGADPSITSYRTAVSQEESVIDVAVLKGYEWEEGQVRKLLQDMIDEYDHVSKKAAYSYQGPPIGPVASKVMKCWEQLPKLYPPTNWRPPPTAGHQGAIGMRVYTGDNWKAAGVNDGSCYLRPMTEAELALQAERC